MKEKNNIEQLERERAELNALIGAGYEFEVEDYGVKPRDSFWGVFKKRTPVKISRSFKIKEPTLGTLDRLSREWIELEIDEERLKDDDPMRLARTIAGKHSKRCARVIALAVLGPEYLVPSVNAGIVVYREDKRRLDELTSLFERTISPSRLYQLITLINAMCNLGDFMHSIRLMSASRTTAPIRIEEESSVG